MKIYAWFCPVCNELMDSETCPKCPEVLLLMCVLDNDKPATKWRRL